MSAPHSKVTPTGSCATSIGKRRRASRSPTRSASPRAQAAVPVLGLNVDEYREVSAIIVYPSAMLSRGIYSGPGRGTVTDGATPILGEAHDRRGPVIVAWDQAFASRAIPGPDTTSCTTSSRTSSTCSTRHRRHASARAAPSTAGSRCAPSRSALRAGVDRPPLQPYGATNPAEFFAVATEAFFDVPLALEQHEPDLYDVLRDYYNQDPAAAHTTGD